MYIKRVFFVLAILLLGACDPNVSDSNASKTQTAINTADLTGEGLVVTEAFMYPPIPGTHQTAIYMRAKNHSAHSLVLNYVHTSVADRVEVHTHIHQDGLMKMRKVNRFIFQPKRSQLFEPGGYHLMVFDLIDNIADMKEFELTFEFEGAKSVTVPVTITSRK